MYEQFSNEFQHTYYKGIESSLNRMSGEPSESHNHTIICVINLKTLCKIQNDLFVLFLLSLPLKAALLSH